MAVTTPTIRGLGTGYRLDEPVLVQWDAFDATSGTLAKVRLRVYDDASRTTTLLDLLELAPDDRTLADRWGVLWPGWWDAAPGVSYYVGVVHVSSVPETSSESSVVELGFETPVGYASWAEAQG